MREIYKKVKIDKNKDLKEQIRAASLALAKQTNKKEWKIKDEHLQKYLDEGHIEVINDEIIFHTTFSTDDANVAPTSQFNLKVARVKRIFWVLNHPKDENEAVFYQNVLEFLVNNGITRESTVEELWAVVESGSGSKYIIWEFEHYLMHEKGYVIPRTSKTRAKTKANQEKAKTTKGTKSSGKGKTSSKGKKSLKSAKNGVNSSKTKSKDKENKVISQLEKELKAIYSRDYYYKNRDKILQYARDYYRANKDEILKKHYEKYGRYIPDYSKFKKSEKKYTGGGEYRELKQKDKSIRLKIGDDDARRKRKRRKSISTKLEDKVIRKPKKKKESKQTR